jgi:hypothetical protein
MPLLITISKSVGAVMPDELDAARGGGKRTGRGRLQRKQRTKAREQRAKAVEAAAREQAEQDDAAASTHKRPAPELTTLRAGVGRLKKEIDKLKKQADPLDYQLESERTVAQ